LKNYAVREKKTVIVTIHQPSSQIFYLLDNLLLLTSGQLAYFGSVNSVVPHFASVGFHMSPHYNPADFVLEKVKGPREDVEKLIKSAQTLEKRAPASPPAPHPVADVVADHPRPRDHSFSSHHSQESCPLWSPGSFGDKSDHLSEAGADIHVVIDVPDNQVPADHIFHKDCDSGRSSLTEMDRTSTKTYSTASSVSSCSEELYFDFTGHSKEKTPTHNKKNKKQTKEQKWCTCFWTQLDVLTRRNFYEARGRMLSKLNFIQTIVLALVTGSIWYQIGRTEETLNDVKGWMFYSMTYWMLFAQFNALVSFPAEREIINKERASGSYRLSSYYLAKMIGELPLTITMPTVYHCISYPMLGSANVQTFSALLAFQILSSIVAQSIGLLVGAACVDLDVSVTISALFSMSSILFGGFYSATMPYWLNWIRYLSIVYYAFQNMQMIEFSLGAPVL
jgi:ABC-type multidrug transport system permease subunit